MRKTREEQEIQDIEGLFERYRQAPAGYSFVPLADACRKIGRLDEALEICEIGVRRHSSYASGHVVMGKCLYDKGDYARARESFERVLLLDENNLVALKYLGMIEADEGNLVAAKQHLERILSLDPENKEIKSVLSLVEEQGRIERDEEETLSATSMEVVDEILEGTTAEPVSSPVDETPSAAPVEKTAALQAQASRGPDEIETSDELASITLADIFASQGYTAKAEKIYREVLRKQPANDVVRDRLREIVGDSAALDDRVAVGDQAVVEKDLESGDPFIAEPALPDAPPELEESIPRHPAEAESTPLSDGPPSSSTSGEEPSTGRSRPRISESDSLGHFKQWLSRLQK